MTKTELNETTLEQKIFRLKEIQQLIETRKVTLTESIPLIEEAYNLKNEIEAALSEIENRLIDLSNNDQGQVNGEI